MNTIELYPHNQKIYDDIVDIMDEPKKIFYTQATGLGKSFILFKLIQNFYKGKRVLYVAPKYAIWNNLQSYSEFSVIENYIDFSTYADFNKIKEHHYDYDALFIDEAHHLTSDIQGANILKLMDLYVRDKKYCFGFTATPNTIKDGKKMINISDYFDNHIFGMDMYDAIINGLFPKIRYAVAIEDDCIDAGKEKYSKKYTVNGTKTVLENIIAENSDINHWLAYFTNIKEMQAGTLNIKKLFPNIKIFYIHHKMRDKLSDIIYEFDNFDGKAILMCVSMLLEGVHPKSVGGVLLYRNVKVSNVLAQIMGRICKIHNNESPLFLDVTNSIYSIKSVLTKENLLMEADSSGNIRLRKGILDINCFTYKYLEYYMDLINGKTRSYRGYAWTSNLDLSHKLGIGSSTIYRRLKKGETYEEIIDWALGLNKQWPKTILGYTFKNDEDLSKQLGRCTSYVGSHLTKGETYEQIINKALKYKESYQTRTISGIKFSSNKELADKLNISMSLLCSRLNSGSSYEEIIERYKGREKVIDKWPKTILGYTFKSDKDLSIQLDRHAGYVCRLKGQGKTYEEIITNALSRRKTKTILGITFQTDVELDKKLGVYIGYTAHYKCKGLSYEEIIRKMKGAL